MAHFERIRDVISGPFSPSLMQQRTAAGWRIAKRTSRALDGSTEARRLLAAGATGRPA